MRVPLPAARTIARHQRFAATVLLLALLTRAESVERVAQSFAHDVAAEQLHRIVERNRRRAAGHRDVERARDVAELALRARRRRSRAPLRSPARSSLQRVEIPHRERERSAHARSRRVSALEQLRCGQAPTARRKRTPAAARDRSSRSMRGCASARDRAQALRRSPPHVRDALDERSGIERSRRYRPLSQSSFGNVEDRTAEREVLDFETRRSARRASISSSSPSADEFDSRAEKIEQRFGQIAHRADRTECRSGSCVC